VSERWCWERSVGGGVGDREAGLEEGLSVGHGREEVGVWGLGLVSRISGFAFEGGREMPIAGCGLGAGGVGPGIRTGGARRPLGGAAIEPTSACVRRWGYFLRGSASLGGTSRDGGSDCVRRCGYSCGGSVSAGGRSWDPRPQSGSRAGSAREWERGGWVRRGSPTSRGRVGTMGAVWGQRGESLFVQQSFRLPLFRSLTIMQEPSVVSRANPQRH
jgi:hypothetical protein